MKLRHLRTLLATASVIVLGYSGVAYALDVPPVPKDIPIVDQTNTLTDEQKNALAARIATERTETGNQIGILMISSLEGQSLEEYSLDVARGWGIGQKDRNSGVLLLIVKDDRRLRIEVGYGLEGALPDIRAGQIIRDRITPQFRQGNYYEGIDAGLVGITTAIHGEADPALDNPDKNRSWLETLTNLAPLLLFGFIWLAAILGRTKSWWAGGILGIIIGTIIGLIIGFVIAGILWIIGLFLFGLLFDFLVSKNYQYARGSGSSPNWWAGGTHLGGGGGFGGFGGGSFGGGGSSGSW